MRIAGVVAMVACREAGSDDVGGDGHGLLGDRQDRTDVMGHTGRLRSRSEVNTRPKTGNNPSAAVLSLITIVGEVWLDHAGECP